jgi:hypothetical protein
VSKEKGDDISPYQYFEYDVQDRLYGILTGLATRIMKKYEQPKRIITDYNYECFKIS